MVVSIVYDVDLIGIYNFDTVNQGSEYWQPVWLTLKLLNRFICADWSKMGIAESKPETLTDLVRTLKTEPNLYP